MEIPRILRHFTVDSKHVVYLLIWSLNVRDLSKKILRYLHMILGVSRCRPVNSSTWRSMGRLGSLGFLVKLKSLVLECSITKPKSVNKVMICEYASTREE